MAIYPSFSPVPTGSSNPLEADLYAPQAQLSDSENISATGNLNIGMVIDYDAHNASRLAGLAKFDNEYTSPEASGTKTPGDLPPPRRLLRQRQPVLWGVLQQRLVAPHTHS